MEQKATIERSSLVEMVRKWGGSATDAVLDHSMRHFHCSEVQGFISYRIDVGCFVSFGDPICALSDRETLMNAFHQFAENEGNHVVYIVASREFAHFA